MSARPDISVVIPVFNSEATIESVVARTRAAAAAAGLSCELVLVDDRSRDDSWNVISRLAAAATDVRAIRLGRNFGQHAALLAGIREARGELTVTIDDDLQHPPEEIPRVVEELRRSGVDVIYGTPRDPGHSRFRNASSSLTKYALRTAMKNPIAGRVSAFRIFRSRLRDAFAEYRSPYVSIDVLLSWSTASFGSIEVEHAPRAAGRSNYTLWHLVRHAITMITGFSAAPLRLASVVGFVSAVFGASVLVYVLGVYLVHGRAVPGFAFLASVIAIFAGAQLFAIGIIGEYLAGIHIRAMGTPSYVIEESVGPAGSGETPDAS